MIFSQDPTGFIVPEDFHLKGELDIKKWVDEKQCYLISKSNTLEELHQNLKKVYLNTVGIEFDHVTNSEERLWLYNNFERHMTQELSKSEKANILKLIVQSESLDEHLGVKFSSFVKEISNFFNPSNLKREIFSNDLILLILDELSNKKKKYYFGYSPNPTSRNGTQERERKARLLA